MMSCPCEVVAAEVTFCEEHHVYKRAGKRLVSCTQLLKRVWAFPPDFSKADPAVLENARDRGIAVDALFTSYVRGQLTAIPAGTREDAMELFWRLKKWHDAQKFASAQAQVILADDEVAGMTDLRADGWLYDVKCTYNIEPMYHLQLGLYAILHHATYGEPVKGLAIVHVTKRHDKPKIIKLDLHDCVRDASTLREAYLIAVRRSGKNGDLNEET